MFPDFGSITIPMYVLFCTGNISFPTLLKYIARNIDNHMANWKVIALINGNIEAVSGPAAQDRPGAHEWIVWQGHSR